MATRKFFLISSLLAVLAIVCQLTSLGYVGRSVSLRAQSVTWTTEQKTEARQEADRILQKGEPYFYVGIALGIAGFVSWLLSQRQDEPAWRLVPLVLLFCYVFTLLIFV